MTTPRCESPCRRRPSATACGSSDALSPRAPLPELLRQDDRSPTISISSCAATRKSARASPKASRARNIRRCRANSTSLSPSSRRSRPGAPRRRSAQTSPRCSRTPALDPDMRAMAASRAGAPPRRKPRRWRRRSASRFCPRTRPTRAARSSKSAPERAATRRLCSPAISFACTSNTPSRRAGRSRSCR